MGIGQGLYVAFPYDLNDFGKVGYSAKRDAWKGYDADEYQNNIEKYQRIEAERRRIKKEEKEARKRKEAEERGKKSPSRLQSRQTVGHLDQTKLGSCGRECQAVFRVAKGI